MACFRVDYCGRGELADRQQKLNQFLSKLTHMAEEFNVCVLMVRSLHPFDRPRTISGASSRGLMNDSLADEPGAIRPQRQRPLRRGRWPQARRRPHPRARIDHEGPAPQGQRRGEGRQDPGLTRSVKVTSSQKPPQSSHRLKQSRTVYADKRF